MYINFTKIYCRTYQYFMKMGMYVIPWRMPRILKGPGSLQKLLGILKKNKLSNILIVTGPNIYKRGLLESLEDALRQEGLCYHIFDSVSQNPTDTEVECGVEVFKREKCTCIIAVGGGSPMDCAKAIGARIARPGRSVRKLQGVFKVLRPVPLLIAVPTTAGSGSETTIAAVITEEKTHHKAAINDLCLMPKMVVLDPKLTVALPPKVTATTGMDALCHAVEAYTNDRYNTEFERNLCRKAVKLIYDNLYVAYMDGENLEARQNMQQAAFYAGRAFTRGSVGYVHAIGHTLSGLYDVPHGMAMAMLLPHVMRAYGSAVDEKLAELYDVCGIQSAGAWDNTQQSEKNVDKAGNTVDMLLKKNDINHMKAEAFLQWIDKMKEKMEIPDYPDMIQKKDISQIAEWAEKEGNPLYPTPVVWTKSEIRQFVDQLYVKNKATHKK